MRKKQKHSFITGIILAAVLALLMISALCIGKYSVSPSDCLSIILSPLLGENNVKDEMAVSVVLGLRLPRILASVTVGFALAVSGASYQGIFKNPLISPDFLGVSSGACIGAALSILLSLSAGFIHLFSFIGGILSVCLALVISSAVRNRSNVMLVISGIMVGSAMSSLLGFLKYTADPETQLASITYWTMGSFSYVKMTDILIILPIIIICSVLLIALSWRINVMSLGENEARTLGVNIYLLRGIVIICATLLTASSVCLAGTIGWIGLIVPHFGRILVGADNRKLIPISGILGGLFMLAVDTLTRIIGAAEMPISILTGLIGAPLFIILLTKRRNKEI